MNWDAIGAIGQAISALALVIVIVQLRHARSETRRAVSQGRAEANREMMATLMNERMASIFTKSMTALQVTPGPAMAALMERAKLTQEEAFSLANFARMHWDLIVQIIPNVSELSAIERHEFDANIRFNYGIASGPIRIVYESVLKPRAHPDAVRYVESVLAQPG